MIVRPHVLIVDDEVGVRESLRAILQTDYQVTTAGSGEAALEAVRRDGIDVMTLDLKMPGGLGGIRVLEQAKQLDPDLEVLIITGYGSLDTAVEGLRHRAFDYLSKPFDCDHVRWLVQMAVARRHAAQRMRNVPEQFLASLSHELRTPLNVIMGYSSILREQTAASLSEEQRVALDRIQSNSTSLLAYVETLLYMAELDRGLMPFAVGPVRVTEVLGRVAAELEPQAAGKGLAWRVDVPADLRVVTDADMLARLVRALADNAVRFTAGGEVGLRARPAAGGITLEVSDSGPGLPAELILETEDVVAGRASARPPRLLGFGLRLAGRLVRALGASITIAASPRGTTCQLVIPELAAVQNGRASEPASA
jgi:signal transduction histidine kinase